MSTVTYYPRSAQEYSLRYSRDTSRKRGTAKLPQVTRSGSLQTIYPLDKVANGPWIAVQADGSSFAVLSRPRPEKKMGERSRERIITKLLGAMSEGEIRSKVQALELKSYSPFGLICIVRHPDEGFRVLNWEWDGRILTSMNKLNEPQLWATSARDETSAKRYRQHQWEKLIAAHGDPGEEVLRHFHFDAQACNDLTPACRGSHEKTSSISEILVSAEKIAFHYHDGPPWVDMPPLELSIPRVFSVPDSPAPTRRGVEINPQNRLHW
ncbi:NRDE family protein [Oscillatoria amoena NRMC-F 0135]|nr:NRDE family protein [Oscillatoria laete-virens]MDL5050540.1 NRDE family protein [Oscillatoria amoena NRMC-F 0135]MDL5055552.1 NRDE family protein [Oscillatoria laete-virens NRMC-F 0139]